MLLQFEGVPKETHPDSNMYDGNGFYVLYDVEFKRDSSGMKVFYSKRSELQVWNSQSAYVVADTLLKRDICLINHVTGNPKKRVSEEFDVADRTFQPTGKLITGHSTYNQRYFG